MITKIATATVYTDDQAAAEKFWVESMGFEVKMKEPMGPNAFWIELSPSGAASSITIYPKAMMENWNTMKLGLVFETDDIAKMYESLKAKGVDIEEPQNLGFGIFTRFRDLDGNEFGLRQLK